MTRYFVMEETDKVYLMGDLFNTEVADHSLALKVSGCRKFSKSSQKLCDRVWELLAADEPTQQFESQAGRF